jgi:hypothetical protein
MYSCAAMNSSMWTKRSLAPTLHCQWSYNRKLWTGGGACGLPWQAQRDTALAIEVSARARGQSAVVAALGPAPYTDRLRLVSRSDWMTVAVGFSPRLPESRIRVAERHLNGRICQSFKRRSATPTRWVLHRGLKPTATLGRRSATKPNQLSTIRVRSRLCRRTPKHATAVQQSRLRHVL